LLDLRLLQIRQHRACGQHPRSVPCVDHALATYHFDPWTCQQLTRGSSRGDRGRGFGYLAPEMATGGAIDGRTDLYALGCVAYYLLTGSLVFESNTAIEMIAKHWHEEPVAPSRRIDRPIPEALDRGPAPGSNRGREKLIHQAGPEP
jgi:hypothetical protein